MLQYVYKGLKSVPCIEFQALYLKTSDLSFILVKVILKTFQGKMQPRDANQNISLKIAKDGLLIDQFIY